MAQCHWLACEQLFKHKRAIEKGLSVHTLAGTSLKSLSATHSVALDNYQHLAAQGCVLHMSVGKAQHPLSFGNIGYSMKPDIA